MKIGPIKIFGHVTSVGKFVPKQILSLKICLTKVFYRKVCPTTNSIWKNLSQNKFYTGLLVSEQIFIEKINRFFLEYIIHRKLCPKTNFQFENLIYRKICTRTKFGQENLPQSKFGIGKFLPEQICIGKFVRQKCHAQTKFIPKQTFNRKIC